MGTSQRFRLPSSLRREKSQSHAPTRPADGKEYKAQHILGLTETALNTARNESISSSATTRLPRLSFSDSTTEFGSSTAPADQSDPDQILHLKASSLLLHEDYHLNRDGASSVRSARLKASASSSTLNSYYDAQRTPLSISQQTSESSRRDFALRKGLPVVVQSITPDRESLRHLRPSRSSKKPESKNLPKEGPRSPVSPTWTLFSSQRSLASSEQPAASNSAQHILASHADKRHKDVRFQPSPPRAPSKNKRMEPLSGSVAARSEVSHVKVNIRRPKVGAKHWFDGLEGESSEDESIHEPELQPGFVAGMEMAFGDDSIGPVPKESRGTATFISESSSQDAGSMPSKASDHASRHALPVSTSPPRISTLNAKSSKSTLRGGPSNKTSSLPSKPRGSPLAFTDLHQTSVLDLSSSEDDETQPAVTDATDQALPRLRDSIAVESLVESEIEIGTAQAVDTKQNSSLQATPSLRRVYGNPARRNTRLAMHRGNNASTQPSTYLSGQPSAPAPEENDLLTSFPPTPTDSYASRRASLQGSCRSDNASIESCRLVSVTRQEESLLAAMRLRKMASNQSNGSSASRRIQAVRVPGRRLAEQPHDAAGSPVGEFSYRPQARKRDIAPSISSANFDKVSYTALQTGASNDASVRFSLASFKTETSLDHETEMSLSLGMASPVLVAPSHSANRMSRVTFFSTSTNDSRDESCSRRRSGYLSTLEELQTVPKRDEISSQDFIDSPYRGWEAEYALPAPSQPRAVTAAAH
ncbi:hypothetical protein A1O1_07629 [Capronia coronata CBS 617.96]|uniref:Uncharacterized protein n=1 Tax=Capronia coronata CBS 617.96 TaxID=1182541 RepID=W9XW38_9EURO|nr:uncharacterized protein A1O1_07629 [Capronia coronata CBS 617.96]EXJ81565.1 hypothetical protein A1O1_07629 [Capronia coronata CBS 617.96]